MYLNWVIDQKISAMELSKVNDVVFKWVIINQHIRAKLRHDVGKASN